jgi:prevent-host-death family protein
MQINIYEAKTRLSELVDQAHQGRTVVIAKSGTPMAKLVPLDPAERAPIRFGLMKGEFLEASDFDAPLPDDLLDQFDGGARS